MTGNGAEDATKHMAKAFYTGSFDPMTNGHLDVIRRGQDLFDRLIVAIGHNPAKSVIFTMQERRDMLTQIIRENCRSHVEVATFDGLTVDYARDSGATAILRGIRNVTDLNFEFQLALTNRAIADIETVFIMTGENFAFTSSTLIKQIATGGQIDRLHRLLPPLVLERMKQKITELETQFKQRTENREALIDNDFKRMVEKRGQKRF